MVGLRISRFQLLSLVVSVLLVIGGTRIDCSAQDRDSAPQRFTEAVSIDVDTSVRKRLGTVSDYLAVKQWTEAIDLLVRISTTQGKGLIEESPGRYLNVERYCNLILAGLPAEALAVYREKFDAQALQWFQTGKSRRDETILKRVIRRSFVSSSGDDALVLLGEFAWEQGKIAKARSYWEQVLPIEKPVLLGEPLTVLCYPDTNLPHAEIFARLVLCSLAEGDRSRSEFELQVFQKMFPNAEGRLAGQTGNLNAILQSVAGESSQWKFPQFGDRTETFALNPKRNGILADSIDVAGKVWSAALPENRLKPKTLSRPALKDYGPLSYFPVVFRDMVLLSDGNRIFAWNLFTGLPYWSSREAEQKTNREHKAAQSSSLEFAAVIYPTNPDLRPSLPLQPVVGVPRHTLTVHNGKLYARMGIPITSHSRTDRELRPVPSKLICLDLADRQGDLVWTLSAGDWGPDWSFEGAPLVEAGRVYVALRRSHPQTQFNVACYDSETGKPIWNRRICSALAPVIESENFISHHLLTLADGAVFFSTDTGAIAALEIADGRLRWIITYESRKPKNQVMRSDHIQWGLVPCLYHQGIVYAAPNDFDGLMAIEARNGLIRWKQRLRGGVRHLLGVAGNKLIVGGNRLWGLDSLTGNIKWTTGYDDPAGYGYGRGVLVGNTVWWPMRDEIFVVNQFNGLLQRKIKISGYPRYETGGNLTFASGFLLIAQPNRLVVFGESGGTPQRSQDFSTVSLPENSTPHLTLKK